MFTYNNINFHKFGSLFLIILIFIIHIKYVKSDITADEKFFNSAREGNAAYVEEYLSKHPLLVSSRDSRGNSAIIIAAGRGRIDVLNVLLKYHANIEDYTSTGLFEGKSALSWASSQGRFRF